MPKVKHDPANQLTAAQKMFLASYIPDICYGDMSWLVNAGRSEFVEYVSTLVFDGQAETGQARIAKNLHSKGLFESLDIGRDILGQQCIFVEFNKQTANAVFDLMNRGVYLDP